jgi:hypothetical protein
VEARPEIVKLAKDSSTAGAKKHKMEVGKYMAWKNRTFWMDAAVTLHVLSTLSAAFVYWSERRGQGKPHPRLELAW